MATKVYMEALSPTMEEGRLISWLKAEGDQINEGDVLAEVETDKATMELVARGSGIMRKQLIGDGDTANVGSVIAVIADEGEDIADLVGGEAEVKQSAGEDEAPAEDQLAEVEEAGSEEEAGVGEGSEAVAAAGQTERDQVQRGSPAPTEAEGGRITSSPLARKLASEGGLDIGTLQGSGPGGRIIKRDVERALEGAPAKSAPKAAPTAPAGEAYTDIPLTQMRKTIARRLTQSIGPVPHFFLTVEVDMGESMSLRKRINERFADQDIKISPNDLIIKATAAALLRHPMVNASWTGDAIRQYHQVDIGVAVAIDEGLITPIIRNASAKGVTDIAQEVQELAARAREMKLKPEEYTGSTFSISNLGMFGIDEFTAVINPPEAAILAVGAVADKVVANNGEMEIRSRMRMTLSCDHRVIDGATGAKFLQTLTAYLEDPLMMIA
ncbi:MAG TPA: pyruvate dehydrogenase complex dihydrolipoamide acetyltransferase [Longimicrobiaceae bacterium]|nr:pyruvate dehydrogenase complex dihydrolipoamide acetyltransferase [Longimicrobiaceae bacterium]